MCILFTMPIYEYIEPAFTLYSYCTLCTVSTMYVKVTIYTRHIFFDSLTCRVKEKTSEGS